MSPVALHLRIVLDSAKYFLPICAAGCCAAGCCASSTCDRAAVYAQVDSTCDNKNCVDCLKDPGTCAYFDRARKRTWTSVCIHARIYACAQASRCSAACGARKRQRATTSIRRSVCSIGRRDSKCVSMRLQQRQDCAVVHHARVPMHMECIWIPAGSMDVSVRMTRLLCTHTDTCGIPINTVGQCFSAPCPH